MELQALIDGLKAHKYGAASYESVDEAIRAFEAMRDVDGEKVVKGLDCCIASKDSCCPKECPYEATCFAGRITQNVYVHLMEDALSLIRQQQERIRELEAARSARVMTLEEVEDALDTVVWLDIPNTENLADGYSLIMAYSHKNGFILLESPFGDNPSQDRFEYKDYGITWRCWTHRPTDEQRKAVKWDG